MANDISEFRELKEMRENVTRNVNSLELCSGCQRICECDLCSLNGAEPVWLCPSCEDHFRKLPQAS